MDRSHFLEARLAYSDLRLDELKTEIAGAVSDLELPDLTIFCVGSFARGEGGEHSDIDLFFAYPKNPRKSARPHTNELHLFGRLIDIIGEKGFQPFSGDAQFLQTSALRKVHKHLGGRKDDQSNYFTQRMLMLLESRCLHGDQAYDEILRKTIDWYFHDAEKHPTQFEPWALINDIERYWRTLLLNYENANFLKRKRDPELNENLEAERRVRKFKLKFSRATTCFATIAAIASRSEPHSRDSLADLVSLTPLARIELAAKQMPAIRGQAERLFDDYAWFLEQTSQTKEQLRSSFNSTADRNEKRLRARRYGDTLFELLSTIDQNRPDESRRLVRHLVV